MYYKYYYFLVYIWSKLNTFYFYVEKRERQLFSDRAYPWVLSNAQPNVQLEHHKKKVQHYSQTLKKAIHGG